MSHDTRVVKADGDIGSDLGLRSGSASAVNARSWHWQNLGCVAGREGINIR